MPRLRLRASTLAGLAFLLAGAIRALGAQARPVSRTVSDAEVRELAALLRIADARRPDTTVLDPALASGSPRVRAHAALVAGQVGARNRVAALRELLRDADTTIAANAAFSLGLVRDTASLDALTRALAGPVTVASAAAWSLGELGDAARPAFEEVLRTRTPATALPAVLVTSSRLRPPPVALIAPYLEDRTLAIQWAATYALLRPRPPGSARPLLNLVIASALQQVLAGGGRSAPAATATPGAREAHEIRALAARGLVRAATGDSIARDAIAALARLLDDPHAQVRVNAVGAIATFGADARDRLLARLEDRDANVRVAAATALAPEHRLTAVDWTRAWRADTAFAVRRAVLLAAARSGHAPEALDPSLPGAWQSHSDWRRRAAVAELAPLLPRSAGSLLGALRRDSDARVRARAWGAYAGAPDSVLPDDSASRRMAMREALGDADALVRGTLLGALSRGATGADAGLFVDAYERARDERDDDARQAALAALAALWRRDSLGVPQADRARIAGWSPPAEPIERAVLATTALAPSWEADLAPSRDMAWYEARVRRFMVPALEGRPLVATLATERGTIEFALLGADAPLTVANFVELAEHGYYRDTRFHRVVPNFVVQDGDPRGDGGGGPGYAIRDELNRRWYERGTVGMALSGPDTGGSQYFLAHSPQPHLDGRYTVFGQVRSGWAVLDAIVQGDRLLSVSVR